MGKQDTNLCKQAIQDKQIENAANITLAMGVSEIMFSNILLKIKSITVTATLSRYQIINASRQVHVINSKLS